ncbi:hypothetical protein AVEN_134668-1 [Araneus ventricosus]|uniref:CAP-Gly domain-containing protein n=1 Tax=Araneus ventricosus TaxID=182803 RepID=A0A4Y2F6D7_ARAVE|nr:hypothetical protein AVEN_134668-1 [Araneus ventricosus]
MENFKLDDRVRVIGKNVKGRIAYIGKTHLSEGIMYGIALDKPKGRCNGAIRGVRYFMCPDDHGVFVRACQLEMDIGNSSDDSEDYRDVIPRPTYPNYLKHSSKLNFKKSKYHSRSKEHVSKVKSPLKQDVHKKQLSEDNTCLESNYQGKIMNDPGLKIKKTRRLSRKPVENRVSIDEKFRFLAEKINTQTQQLDTIRRYLKKLKTYVRWSRGFDSKENKMKNLLDGAIDGVIRNMEETIGCSETGNVHDHRKGDAGLEKENALLLQCIWDLEKKNETLVECMTKIRAFLLKSWRRRSRDKSKSDANRKETSERPGPSENKCNNSSPKNSETQSVPNLPTKSPQPNEISRKDSRSKRETIKRFLESLKYGDGSETQEASSSSLLSKKENRLSENSKGDAQKLRKAACVRNYLESLNHDIKELNKELCDMRGEKSGERCEEKVSSKSNLIYENTKSPILKENRNSKSYKMLQSRRSPRDDIQSKPYSLDKRLKREQNAFRENTDITKDEKDPTKELFELISNIMTNISLSEQEKMEPKDSPKFKEQSTNPSETYAIAGKCHSNPDSDKFEKMTNSSNKSKSGDNLKLSKSVADASMKRKKSPKKRLHVKQIMDSRKQPTPQGSEKKD